MARKPRDYAAEYARRVARERERAAKEGRAYDVRRARGHKEHRETERLKNRLRYWTRRTRTDPVAVRDAVSRLGGDAPAQREVIDLLQEKAQVIEQYRGGHKEPGQERWTHRKEYLPIELYYYHGGILG
jgi:hypothetical protein